MYYPYKAIAYTKNCVEPTRSPLSQFPVCIAYQCDSKKAIAYIVKIVRSHYIIFSLSTSTKITLLLGKFIQLPVLTPTPYAPRRYSLLTRNDTNHLTRFQIFHLVFTALRFLFAYDNRKLRDFRGIFQLITQLFLGQHDIYRLPLAS